MANYRGWVNQSADEFLPDWLKSNLREVCECGYSMENYYNEKGMITKRRCSNPNCFHKLALKIVGMCDILQVKGIGEATAEKIVLENKLTNHYEALSKILNKKPRISLYTYLRIAFIEGIDTSWAEVTDVYSTLDDIFENYKGRYRTQLDKNKDLLYEGLKFVDVIEPYKPKYQAVLKGTVMISGNLRGWSNRNDFIASINQVMDGLVQLSVSENKRKTGILALIQEADTPHRGKYECARENGIPVKTPAEFQSMIASIVKEKLKLE